MKVLLTPQFEDAWFEWLDGKAARSPLPLWLPNANWILETGFAQMVDRRPEVLDWVFPADAFGAESGEGLVLDAVDVWRLLEATKADNFVRKFYVAFLRELEAVPDAHGHVGGSHAPPTGMRTKRLNDANWRRVTARVLRFLHVAGWQGFSTTEPERNGELKYDSFLAEDLRHEARFGGFSYAQAWEEALRLPVGPAGERRVHQFQPLRLNRSWHS